MSAALAPVLAAQIEQVLIGGDMSKLKPEDRLAYYNRVCDSLGLNPLTKPFEYLTLQGKTILYAKKDATDQLRAINKVSVHIVSREVVDGVYVVTARGTRPDGREDESIGALPLPQNAVERANAIMKCETKAKRRVTLSICGLGWLDETEIETIGSREAQEQVRDRKLAEISASQLKQLPAGDPITAEEIADAEPEPPPMTITDAMMQHPNTWSAPAGTKDYEAREKAKRDEAAAALDQHVGDDPKAIKPGAKKTSAKRPRGMVSFDVLKFFGEIKKQLREMAGDDRAYYAILGSHRFEHADAIVDNDQARIIYKELAGELNRLKQDKELRSLLEETRTVLGGPAFNQILGNHGCEELKDVLAMPSEPLTTLLNELKAASDDRRSKS